MMRNVNCNFGILVLLLLIASISICDAQSVFNKTYAKEFGRARSIDNVPGGGFIVNGYTLTENFGFYSADIFLLKIDEDGKIEMSKSYGGEESDNCYSAISVNAGGYLMAGFSRSFSGIYHQSYLIRTNNQGDTMWTRMLSTSNGNRVWEVMEAQNGDFIGVGEYNGGLGFIFRMNDNGDTLWTKGFSKIPNYYYNPYGVVELQNNDLMVVGSQSYSSGGDQDMFLIRLTASGKVLHTKILGASERDWAVDIEPTKDGGFVLGGITRSYGNGSNDFCLVKVDSMGNEQWSKAYGGIAREYVHGMNSTPDGGYIMVGYTKSHELQRSDNDERNGLVVKTDSMGNLEWARTVWSSDTLNYDRLFDVVATDEGDYVISGMADSDVEYPGIYIIKMGKDGVSGCKSKSVQPVVTDFNMNTSNNFGGNFRNEIFKISNPSGQVLDSTLDTAITYCDTCLLPQPGFLIDTTDTTVMVADTSIGAKSMNWWVNGEKINTKDTLDHSILIDGVNKVCQEVINGCGSDSTCLNVYYEPSSVHDITASTGEEDLIHIAPNPFKDNLKIKLRGELRRNTNQLRFELNSLGGRSIFKHNFHAPSAVLDLTEYSNGLYMYRLMRNGQIIQSGKVVKLD